MRVYSFPRHILPTLEALNNTQGFQTLPSHNFEIATPIKTNKHAPQQNLLLTNPPTRRPPLRQINRQISPCAYKSLIKNPQATNPIVILDTPRWNPNPALPARTHMPATATTPSHISYHFAVSDNPRTVVMVASHWPDAECSAYQP